jgi:catechol 2,3-dioxygenase-like lactoylglutathione lyase family enzyme
MKWTIVAAAMLSGPALAQGGGVAQPMAGGIKGLHHAAITVSDIDATIAFYGKAVPYTLVKRYTVKGSTFAGLTAKRAAKVEIALVAMPTGFIQLMDFAPGKPAPPNERAVIGPGYTHICFQSPSTDPAVKRFAAVGLKNISRWGKPDGVDIGGYGVRYAYGRDPDGVMIENESLDRPRRKEAAWITHIANTVHDRDRMLAFYGQVIGKAAHRTIEQDNRPRLDDVANIDGLSIRGGWINAGNMEIEVWQYVKPQTPAPRGDRKLDEIGYNAFALEVADLKAERARLKALSVRFAGKPLSLGGWRVQYAYDPEGNLFALQQRIGAPATESVESLPPA